ncbi:MAG: hypothetical protein KDN05_02255 [Verrucomicrobiae bacterium]|nr:hypothetical protein [Verrucomicrobiae bacterium]MCP5548352.1 hypothetical protein [Akkermansiaceae bacterium]
MLEEIKAIEEESPAEGFQHLLRWTEAVADQHGLSDPERIPSLATQEGENRRAAICLVAEAVLSSYLEADNGCDEEVRQGAPSAEDLRWLADAKNGKRFWQILLAAVEFGRSIEDYQRFESSKVEETVLRLSALNPGRQTSPEGRAVDKIVAAFQARETGNPTPTTILKFLGGRRPGSDEEPLIVDHLLWTKELTRVSWGDLKNLVKSANRRLKTK